nr:bHLH09 [Pinus massoniana]
MEDLQSKTYPYRYSFQPCSSSYSQAAACLPHYYGNNNDPGACIDDDAVALIFEDLCTKRPHDYGSLGIASIGPAVQIHQIAEDNSSPAVEQYPQQFVANIDDLVETLTCSSPVSSLVSSVNPIFPPTRSRRTMKAAAGGGGHYNEAVKESIGNAHLHKLVERQRRSKMKALCSTLLSLLPQDYNKTKCTLSDKLLEAVKHIRHLQNKLIELEKKRDVLKYPATVNPFSNSFCNYKTLQASELRSSNVRDKFQTIRVSKFGPGIQVTVNIFKNQIDFSSLLTELEEAGLEVVIATVTAINDRVFYTIHSKMLDFRHFDSAFLHRRVGQLIDGSLPKCSMTE